jgi:hypothetical protein
MGQRFSAGTVPATKVLYKLKISRIETTNIKKRENGGWFQWVLSPCYRRFVLNKIAEKVTQTHTFESRLEAVKYMDNIKCDGTDGVYIDYKIYEISIENEENEKFADQDESNFTIGQ